MKKYCEYCDKFFGIKSNFCSICGRQLIDKGVFDINKEFVPFFEGTYFTIIRKDSGSFGFSFKPTEAMPLNKFNKVLVKDSQTLFERLTKTKAFDLEFNLVSLGPLNFKVYVTSSTLDLYSYITIPVNAKNIKLLEKCRPHATTDLKTSVAHVVEQNIPDKKKEISRNQKELKELIKIKSILNKLK